MSYKRTNRLNPLKKAVEARGFRVTFKGYVIWINDNCYEWAEGLKRMRKIIMTQSIMFL